MTNFDRYLSDINAEMLQDIAKKRKRNRMLSDVFQGVIVMGMMCLISYYILTTF